MRDSEVDSGFAHVLAKLIPAWITSTKQHWNAFPHSPEKFRNKTTLQILVLSKNYTKNLFSKLK